MTCSVMQPTYLPWLGYFDLIEKSDVFIIYDSVQFEKQSWQQRNYIRNKGGKILLTLPVKSGNGLEKKIKEVEIDTKKNIALKHLKSIEYSYSKSKNFKNVFPRLTDIYSTEHTFLLEFNIELIKFGMQQLEINTPLKFSSDLNIKGKKVEALVDICNKINADHYYSPEGSRVYIEENNLFVQNNITLTYQTYKHPVYQQINYPDFISHLSFIDYLFNR